MKTEGSQYPQAGNKTKQTKNGTKREGGMGVGKVIETQTVHLILGRKVVWSRGKQKPAQCKQ